MLYRITFRFDFGIWAWLRYDLIPGALDVGMQALSQLATDVQPKDLTYAI